MVIPTITNCSLNVRLPILGILLEKKKPSLNNGTSDISELKLADPCVAEESETSSELISLILLRGHSRIVKIITAKSNFNAIKNN